MAQTTVAPAAGALSQMRRWAGWMSAIAVAALFLIAGLWKLTDPAGAGARLAQARVPEFLSVPAAIILGTCETFAAILLLRPLWRRWGALLSGLLLFAFMAFIAIHYSELRGQECNCFPWIRRAVGPAFFIGDGAMLALAIAAGVLSRPSAGLRRAAIVLIAVCVFAGGSFAVSRQMHRGTEAPASITAENGHAISLQSGKVFIFFFNPQCMHCLEAGRKLSALHWGSTRFIGVATENPQFGSWFMGKAGLKTLGIVSRNLDELRKTFPFDTPPAGVALEDGREKAMLLQFEGAEPERTLKQLGFVR